MAMLESACKEENLSGIIGLMVVERLELCVGAFVHGHNHGAFKLILDNQHL